MHFSRIEIRCAACCGTLCRGVPIVSFVFLHPRVLHEEYEDSSCFRKAIPAMVFEGLSVLCAFIGAMIDVAENDMVSAGLTLFMALVKVVSFVALRFWQQWMAKDLNSQKMSGVSCDQSYDETQSGILQSLPFICCVLFGFLCVSGVKCVAFSVSNAKDTLHIVLNVLITIFTFIYGMVTSVKCC